MGKAPAFQFYPNDWSRDLEEHPLEVEGAWIRICCKLWWSDTRGELTRTYDQWGRILRVDTDHATRILTYLGQYHICDISVTDNAEVTVRSRRMYNEDKERRQAAERQRRKREREVSHDEVTDASSSSSSYFNKKTISLNGSFDVFYQTYPRHTGRKSAEKAWLKLMPDESLRQTMLKAIAVQKDTLWRGLDIRYIPHPATWLNGRRWEDEVVVKGENANAFGKGVF